MATQLLEHSALNWSTRAGFFVADGGVRYWVFQSFQGMFAVSLDSSNPFPEFTAHQLRDEKIATGAWLGPVKVKPGSEVRESFRDRVGLLGTSGLRWFIKVPDKGGSSTRLAILPSDLGVPQRHTSFFPNWKLFMAIGPSQVCVFESPARPSRVTRHRPAFPPPRLAWSSGTPEGPTSE